MHQIYEFALITALHTLDILSMSFMRLSPEMVIQLLEGIPRGAEHLLALLPSLSGPSHPKPSRLGLGQVTVQARSSGAALHLSPSWSNSPYTAWRCVWGHCPDEK